MGKYYHTSSTLQSKNKDANRTDLLVLEQKKREAAKEEEQWRGQTQKCE